MRTIPREEVITKIRAENSWWAEPHEIPKRYRDLQQRPYFDLVFSHCTSLEPVRAFVLMGPRRVGKTVILFQVIQKLINGGADPKTLCYIDIESPLFNGLSFDDFISLIYEASGISKDQQLYFFFDEMQYLKEWEVHLKTAVDRYDNIKFIVSGSSAAALRLKSKESGAGRFTDFTLPPLTFYEYITLLDLNHLLREWDESIDCDKKGYHAKDIDKLNEHFINYINFGGYPEVIFSETIQSNPGRYIKSDIIDKVLLRDLPSLYGITDIQELNSLFTTLAYNSGNEVSLEGLSQSSGVAKNTIKRYIEYLEAAFLIKRVNRIDCNAKRFIRANHFKVYLTNPSMRCALFAPLSDSSEAIGDMVETAVFSQWFHLNTLDLHYARWGGGDGEVDIVNLGDDLKVRWAIEVKWSDKFEENPSELKSLIKFCKLHENCIISSTTKTKCSVKTLYEGKTIKFTPASVYCYTLSYNIIRRQRVKSNIKSYISRELHHN